jgi:hypothetical protein
MSYDLRVCVKAEGCDVYPVISEPEYMNPTYNLGTMFRACMNWDFKQGEYYRCDYVMPKVEHGIEELKHNRKKYEQYNPSNGWGSIDSAIQDLESLRACIYEEAEDIPLNCLYMRW